MEEDRICIHVSILSAVYLTRVGRYRFLIRGEELKVESEAITVESWWWKAWSDFCLPRSRSTLIKIRILGNAVCFPLPSSLESRASREYFARATVRLSLREITLHLKSRIQRRRMWIWVLVTGLLRDISALTLYIRFSFNVLLSLLFSSLSPSG